MKLIFVSDNAGATRSLSLSKNRLIAMAVSVFCVLGVTFSGAFYLALHTQDSLSHDEAQSLISQWRQETELQHDEVIALRDGARQEVRALAIRLAELQARLIRMEAVGQRLTDVAKLNRGEFDFDSMPAVGGPEDGDLHEQGGSISEADLVSSLDALALQLRDREEQLGVLESLLENRKIADLGYIAGRPIKKGWLSSHFGKRVDPFHGRIAWHKGVDFAGKEDAEIITVASGVVSWSGDRYGYGQMVEVNHGNGYVTRYAHNKENRVAVGDVVKKGQVIALMGSTGRSTGPHVHYEVYKNGKAVDPKRYIYRANRS